MSAAIAILAFSCQSLIVSCWVCCVAHITSVVLLRLILFQELKRELKKSKAAGEIDRNDRVLLGEQLAAEADARSKAWTGVQVTLNPQITHSQSSSIHSQSTSGLHIYEQYTLCAWRIDKVLAAAARGFGTAAARVRFRQQPAEVCPSPFSALYNVNDVLDSLCSLYYCLATSMIYGLVLTIVPGLSTCINAPVTSVILLREDIKTQQIVSDQTAAKRIAELKLVEDARDEALQQIIQGEKNLEEEQKKSLELKLALEQLLAEEKAALAKEKEERCA